MIHEENGMKRFTGIFFMLATFCSQAATCNKVVITGYQSWAPYSSVEKDELKGVGIDIATQLFQNLDIPMEFEIIDKPSHMALLLKQGEIDVLVATYDVPELHDAVVLAEPAYFEDALAIVVASDRSMTFNRWSDLMGYTGIAVNQTQVGAQFADFAKNYLSLEYVPSLEAAFHKIENREGDYIIGSLELLRHHLIQSGKVDNFAFLDNLVQPEPVYLAFSKESPCREYLPYIQERIRIMKNSGTIESLLQKYAVE